MLGAIVSTIKRALSTISGIANKLAAEGSASPIHVTVTVVGKESRGPYGAHLSEGDIRSVYRLRDVYAVFFCEGVRIEGTYTINAKSGKLSLHPASWHVVIEVAVKGTSFKSEQRIPVIVEMNDGGVWLDELVVRRYERHKRMIQSRGRPR